MAARIPAAVLLAELARRQALRSGEKARLPVEVFEGLHPKQRAFVIDPARSKAALCGRRSGKSHGDAVFLLDGAWEDPDGLSVFVARSKGDARRIVGTALDQISKQHSLKLWSREIDNQLYYQCPNGHRIWLAGAKNVNEAEKFRGPKYKRVVIDEAQTYSFLGYMVADIFRFALMDKQGSLALTGTPGPVPIGLFYTATTGDGGPKWSTHTWTVYDNPFLPNVEEELREICKDIGITDFSKREAHTTYRREVLAQWILDLAALVAPFEAQLNSCRRDQLPEGKYDYAVIVDLGAGAAASTAFVTMAQRRGFPETYILSAEKKADMIPSKVAAYAEHLCRQLPTWPQLIVDEGGLGKGYADEMRKTYGLNAVAAEKSKKRAYLELFAGDLRAGTIKLDPYTCRPLVDEMQLCQWTADKSEIDDRFEDHALMAAVYGARALRPNYRPEYEREVDEERELVKRQVAQRMKRQRGRTPWLS